ncbi:dr1-associated corepressor homolog [Rosa chinensis]|uniref:dr1-associated corepressor homolog n=1 Tax=Rosa chinensis TaxID=74649 RepID=UPI000D096384|nr:dr1-associated corepressor homolog [Rosa chinensis]
MVQHQPQSQMQTMLHAPVSPPGFNTLPVSAQTTYLSIPAIPYGFSPINAYTITEPILPITGFYAGRGNPRFNNGQGGRMNNFGVKNGGFGLNNSSFNNSGFNNGGNFNAAAGGFGFINNNTNQGFNNGGGKTNGNPVACQLCGKNGHGARTCRTLSNYPGFNNGQNFNNNGGCQFCGKMNHTVDRCYYIIGFPNQQQHQNEDKEVTAMLAATTNTPQFWLADTSATNHMTSNAQMLHNTVPYTASDSV